VVDSVLRFAEHAEKVGATVGIEPGTEHTLGSIELVCELLQRVDSDRLQIVIDPVNLLRPEIVEKQPAYWQKAFDLFGDRIKVFHVKDVKYENGKFVKCVLGHGIIDFDFIFGWMNRNKPDIPLLREDANPAHAQEEIAFMKSRIK
jgi:sugar phosphate isomerase/epimerase